MQLRRRDVLRQAGMGAVAGSLRGAGTKPPNILFLFPDQLRHDFVERPGIDGVPVRTPNLKRLMQEGAWFRRAVTPAPLCAPARA